MYLVHNFSRFSTWLLLPMHHGGKSMSQRRVVLDMKTQRENTGSMLVSSPPFILLFSSLWMLLGMCGEEGSRRICKQQSMQTAIQGRQEGIPVQQDSVATLKV